ncbi:MAG TPA: ABC transporter substrate-binding protein [Burkholderiales bacterium]|jgi:branched-chain amino acid transport system substrate-binding protein|nr:ABC transporter substrate-binding protein [Burkholderiales bacterium]
MRTILAYGAAALAMAMSTAQAEPGISKDTIKLGSYLPLQSGLAAGATQMKEGTEAYFKWVNDNGGVNGRKIEWIVENDSYNPQQTVAVVKKLVDRDDVFAVVSTLGTVTNLAVLPFLHQRGVPVINPAGGHLNLNKPKDKNVFGILPLSSEIGESMADYALTKLGAKKIAIFFQNDQFGKDQRDGAVEYLKKKNMAPAAEASYVPADVDISAQVIALRQAQPDAVLLAVIPKHGSLFMKEAQKLGWKPKVVGHNTMADPVVTDLAGDALEGIYVNLMTAVDSMDTPQVKQANEILAKYSPKTKPGYYPYLGMAGAKIFVEGAKKAGKDLTRAKLIKSLEDMKHIETGLVPPLDWSATYHGGPLKFGYATWQGGKLKVLQGW